MIRLRHQRNVVEDVVEILDHIARLPKNATNKIAAVVRQGHAENFAGQRSGSGAPWASLKLTTQLERQHLGFSPARPILVRRGDYRNTFTNQRDPDHVEIVEHVDAGVWLWVGTRDIRAGTLEDGRGAVPARPVLPISSAARTKLGDTITSIIDLLIKNNR